MGVALLAFGFEGRRGEGYLEGFFGGGAGTVSWRGGFDSFGGYAAVGWVLLSGLALKPEIAAVGSLFRVRGIEWILLD